jgi:N-methylhydantoinase A
VPLDDVDMEAPDLIDQVVDRFRRRHEALYTYSATDQDVVLVNARVAVVGTLPVVPVEPPPAPAAVMSPKIRRVYMDGWVDVPVHRWDDLGPSATLDGPAIVESATTTVVAREHDRILLTPHGWLEIQAGPATR